MCETALASACVLHLNAVVARTLQSGAIVNGSKYDLIIVVQDHR